MCGWEWVTSAPISCGFNIRSRESRPPGRSPKNAEQVGKPTMCDWVRVHPTIASTSPARAAADASKNAEKLANSRSWLTPTSLQPPDGHSVINRGVETEQGRPPRMRIRPGRICLPSPSAAPPPPLTLPEVHRAESHLPTAYGDFSDRLGSGSNICWTESSRCWGAGAEPAWLAARGFCCSFFCAEGRGRGIRSLGG